MQGWRIEVAAAILFDSAVNKYVILSPVVSFQRDLVFNMLGHEDKFLGKLFIPMMILLQLINTAKYLYLFLLVR